MAKESELDVLYTISTILTWSTLSITSKDDIPWHMSVGPINTCTMNYRKSTMSLIVLKQEWIKMTHPDHVKATGFLPSDLP